MASLILGSIGSSVLGPVGGFLGSALGSYIDNYLFAPAPPDVKGPRIADLGALRADPGTPIPLVFGADRVSGIIIASTDLIETVTNKKVGGKGGKSSTQTTYTYKIDVDIMLAEGPILGVGRIWADGKLIRGARYNLLPNTSANPEKIGGIPYPVRYAAAAYDPKLVPWSLDPTYTATASATRYTLNADKTTFSVISAGSVAGAIAAGTIVYWQDTSSGYYIPLIDCHAYSPDSKAAVYSASGASDSFTHSAMAGAGTVHMLTALNSTPDNLLLWAEPGNTWFTMPFGPGVTATPISSGISLSNSMYLARDFDLLKLGVPVEAIDAGTLTVDIRIDSHQRWGGGNANILSIDTMHDDNGDGVPDLNTSVYHVDVATAVWNVTAPNSATATVTATIPAGARFLRIRMKTWDGIDIYPKDMTFHYAAYSPSTGSSRTWDSYYNLFDAISDWSEGSVLAYTGSNNVSLYRGTDDQIADPSMAVALSKAVPAYIGRAHMVFDGLELNNFGNRLPNLTFECIRYDNDRVSTVVADLIDRSGIGTGFYDVTALNNLNADSYIMGYTVAAKTSFRAAIEQIIGAYAVDVAEIGDTLQFRDTRRATDHVISYDDMGAALAGRSNNKAPITLSYRDKMEMPMRLTIKFKDAERDYQPNAASYRRQVVTSVQDSTSEIAAVIPSDKAKRAVRDKMQDLWLERVSAKFALPHKYIYVSPTDVVDLQQNGVTKFRMKVSVVTRGANGLLELSAVARDITHYTLQAGETNSTSMSGGYNLSQTSSSTLGYTNTELMDLPPLRDHDDVLGYYAIMGGSSVNWPGGSLYRSINGLISYDFIYGSTSPATVGRVSASSLLYRPACKIDMDSSFEVTLDNSGMSLSSVAVAELLAGSNYALVGNEVINFKDATLISGTTYRIDGGILRGRRGTDSDSLLSGHTVNEQFALLDTATVMPLIDDIANIGRRLPYKAVTNGANIANIRPLYFTNTAKRLRPFSVVGVSGVRNGAGDLTISWSRRNRVYFAWVDNTDIPMSEQSEQYEIDITDSTGSVVFRTLTATAPTVIYTAAQQAADGISGPYIYASIYQMSAVVGRGNIRREIL